MSCRGIQKAADEAAALTSRIIIIIYLIFPVCILSIWLSAVSFAPFVLLKKDVEEGGAKSPKTNKSTNNFVQFLIRTSLGFVA